ncbi:hypothetical protein ACIGMX_16845 [Streptomyces aquilus]|uniref:hypothetical protein n=1 Tax=Streptomyces aquilus TaxID=2548456 RepID=UPI0037CDAAD2
MIFDGSVLALGEGLLSGGRGTGSDEGELVVTPLLDGHHEHCISQIVEQLYRRSSTDVQFSANKGLKLRSADGCPEDHVIPDGTFVLRESRLFRGAESWMPGEGVAMVLEVTAGKAETDREQPGPGRLPETGCRRLR